MPTFGDYETVGEPIATGEERSHASTVWRAVKPGASDGREYVVKCYVPRQRSSRSTETESLSRDRGLEFLEGIKEQKKAQAAGGRSLAPIHEFGIGDTGAWYVTDYFPRANLKAWITKKGRVDNAGLRHVVAELVAGCLALKRSRSYSHGNLKVSNAFRAGKKGTFHQTPILLTDPYPAGPARDLDVPNTELLGRVMEAQDLRAIGEVLLQLVEGRLLASSEDYNWPIALTAPWKNLGKDGERWLQLCNQLLDGNRSPEALNLETLAQEFRPPAGKGKVLLAMAATVVAVCILGGGIFAIKTGSAKRNQERFDADLQAAKQAHTSTNLNGALTKVNAALVRQPDSKEAAALKGEIETDIDRAFNSAIQSGNAKLTPFTEPALTEAERFLGDAAALKPKDAAVSDLRRQIEEQRVKLNRQAVVAVKREELTKVLAEARTARDNRRFAEATNAFGRAAALADEIQESAMAGEARAELEKAQKALENLSEQDRWRSEITGLIASARVAGSTNGWQAASNHLNRALDLGQKLSDQVRVGEVKQELQRAQVGWSNYQAQKAQYDEFQAWMNKGKASDSATVEGLKIASNAYYQAQILAPKLNDPTSQTDAKRAFQTTTNQLHALVNRAQMVQNFTQLMGAGSEAARTNGWSSATNSFGQASGVARRLGDSNRLAQAEEQLKTAQTRLEELGKRQKSLLELTELIAQAKQAEGQKTWNSASNLFYLASAMAEKLNDPRLAETRDGLGKAAAAMQQQAQDDQYRAEVAGLMKSASGAVATNGWSAATNFYAQAIKAANQLPERTLQLQAEAEYKNALEKLNAEVSTQLRQAAYKQAMTSAREKLALNDLQGAVDQADVALKNVPNDPDATKLREDAAKKLEAANAEKLRKQQYEAAMAEANRAYQGGDYATAKKKADEALGVQPDDSAAKKLRDEAQAKLEQQGKIAAELATLDSQLQDLMKQFKVKAQGASILPERSAKPALRGAVQTDAFLKSSAYLREQYKAKVPLDAERQKCLDALDSAITRWNSSF